MREGDSSRVAFVTEVMSSNINMFSFILIYWVVAHLDRRLVITEKLKRIFKGAVDFLKK